MRLKAFFLLISIALCASTATPLPTSGKEAQEIEDKFFPDGRGNPSKGDDRIYRIAPEK